MDCPHILNLFSRGNAKKRNKIQDSEDKMFNLAEC